MNFLIKFFLFINAIVTFSSDIVANEKELESILQSF